MTRHYIWTSRTHLSTNPRWDGSYVSKKWTLNLQTLKVWTQCGSSTRNLILEFVNHIAKDSFLIFTSFPSFVHKFLGSYDFSQILFLQFHSLSSFKKHHHLFLLWLPLFGLRYVFSRSRILTTNIWYYGRESGPKIVHNFCIIVRGRWTEVIIFMNLNGEKYLI